MTSLDVRSDDAGDRAMASCRFAMRTLLRRGAQVADAEDAAQDAVLAALRQGEAGMPRWTLTVAWRAFVRARVARQRAIGIEEPSEPYCSGAGPAEAAAHAELCRALARCRDAAVYASTPSKHRRHVALSRLRARFALTAGGA